MCLKKKNLTKESSCSGSFDRFTISQNPCVGEDNATSKSTRASSTVNGNWACVEAIFSFAVSMASRKLVLNYTINVSWVYCSYVDIKCWSKAWLDHFHILISVNNKLQCKTNGHRLIWFISVNSSSSCIYWVKATVDLTHEIGKKKLCSKHKTTALKNCWFKYEAHERHYMLWLSFGWMANYSKLKTLCCKYAANATYLIPANVMHYSIAG